VFKFKVQRDKEESERLVKDLLANGGTRSPATVLSVRRGRVTELTGLGIEEQLRFWECKVNVRVEPPNGAPFEAAFTQILEHRMLGALKVRPAAFNVIYDPANLNRIALDIITWREQQIREMTPQLNAIKSMAAEFQQSGGIAGHLDRLQSIGANPPAGPPQPPPDGVDELTRLGELRASGALTEKQFAAAKAELLRRL
jgi:hypothetical protein